MAPFNFSTFWVLLEHFVSVMPLLGFAFLFRLAVIQIYAQEENVRQILLFMDNVMVIGVVAWVIYQTGVELWNRRKRFNSLHVFALA